MTAKGHKHANETHSDTTCNVRIQPKRRALLAYRCLFMCSLTNSQTKTLGSYSPTVWLKTLAASWVRSRARSSCGSSCVVLAMIQRSIQYRERGARHQSRARVQGAWMGMDLTRKTA